MREARNMLILTRKLNEGIMIGDQIEISVIDIRGEQVKIGIKAPRSVKVYRQEIYRAIQNENIQAARAKPADLPDLGKLFTEDIQSSKSTSSNPKQSD